MAISNEDLQRYGFKPEVYNDLKKRMFKATILEVDKGHFSTSLSMEGIKKGRKLFFTGVISNKVLNRMGLKKGDTVFVLIERDGSFTLFRKA